MATAWSQPKNPGLQKISNDLDKGVYTNTHAVIVEHNGRVVFERYLSGEDERWGDKIPGRIRFQADTLHDLRSASKSVTSALVGIALGNDAAKALTRPLSSFFPKRKLRPELQAVTLEHVLTMRAGFEWNEMTVPYTDSANDEIRMSSTHDPVGFVLDHRLRDKPGSTWYYSGGLTQVLAGVVQELTGKPLDLFAKTALFEPLGITNYEWIADPAWNPPMPAAASGLRMRPRDLSKFGSVFLNDGKWQGRQVVPRAWVEASTRRHVASIGDWSGPPKWGYGYQWWIGTIGGQDVAAAVGNGNQRVFVLKKLRMVVTVLAGEYNKFEGHSERLLSEILKCGDWENSKILLA